MNLEDFAKQVQYWAVAVIEMVVATATFEAIFSHAASLFWAIVVTVVIYFVNRFLKKNFQ